MHPFMGIGEWDRVGLSVEESARRLRRIAYLDRRLMKVEAGHMAARPEYEVKGALGRMIWQDAAHCDQLRARCRQLRMSPAAFDKCPDERLGELADRVLDAGTTLMLLSSLFDVVKPAQIAAIQAYLELAQPLVDEPSVHLLRHQLLDREEQVRWGREALHELRALASEAEIAEAERWSAFIRALLDAAGGVDGTAEALPVPAEAVVPHRPFELPRSSPRDGRFSTAVSKHEGIAFSDDPEGRFKMMLFNRFFEMTAAEAVAYVHFTAEGKPWAFYYDTARHIWDETRHAWFGEAALRQLGYDIHAVPNWIGWYEMTANLFEREEAYTHLTIAIEKAAMKYPPGKREEWEFCRDIAKHPLMTTFQDFDWADEVVHAGFGQRWIVEHLYGGDVQQALAAADTTVKKRTAFMARQAADGARPGDAFAGGY